MTHSRLGLYARVAAFNLLVSVLLVAGFDIFLFDRKLHILPCYQYLPAQDLVVHRPNLNERWSYGQIVLPEKKNREFEYRVITDPDGCRVGIWPAVRRGGPNLVVLGDSVSFGAHANFADTVAGGLERRFPGSAVWDFGVCGMDSSSYAPILSHFMAKKAVRPSVLVVGLNVDMTTGDLPRALARKRYGTYKAIGGYLVGAEKYEELRSSAIRRGQFIVLMDLRRYSSLFNILFPVKDIYGKFALPLLGLQEEKFPALRQVELENMEEVRKTSGLTPGHIVVWLIPDRNEHLWKILGRPDPTGFYRKCHSFWDGMKRRFEEEGYRVVDPRDELEALYFKKRIYPFTVDTHLNADGFHAVTALLAPAVAEAQAGAEIPRELHPPPPPGQ